MISFNEYLGDLKDSVFRILYLNDINSPDVDKYIEGVRLRIIGAGSLFNWDKYGKKYNEMVVLLQFLATSDFTKLECRKIVLDIVNDLDRIQKNIMRGDMGAN